MRIIALLATALITIAAPALAQDRTPPAGDARGFEAPTDWTIQQTRAPFEGRSVSRQTAPAQVDHGPSDDR